MRFKIVLLLLGWMGTGWAGETVETILIRKVLGDELTGWNTGNVKLVALQYAPHFRGYGGDAGGDPFTWRPEFQGVGELEAFCREAVSKYRFVLARNPVYFDIHKNRALVVAEEEGEAVERTSGKSVPLSHQSLWTLEKEGGTWWITGFLRRLPKERAGVTGASGEVRDLLLREAEAWQEGNLKRVVDLYGRTFVGYEGYDKGDPKKWRVAFSGTDPFRAFCKKRLDRTKYHISRKVLSVKVQGGLALALTEEQAYTTHNLTGKTLSARHRDLWMLARKGKAWRIVGFVRRLGEFK